MLLATTPSEYLSQSRLLRDLPQEVIQSLSGLTQKHYFQKNQTLFSQGDNAHHVYIIVQGWVKLFRDTLDGKEYIVDVLSEHMSFGEHALFSGNIYDYSAQAVEPLTVLSIPLQHIRHLMEHSVDFMRVLLRHFARQQAHARDEFEHLAVQTAAQRVGCFLLRLCPRDAAGSMSILLPYDKTLLASRLGMQRETFSRALSSLQKSANIQVNGAEVTIQDIHDLSSYCCSACSNSFPCDDT